MPYDKKLDARIRAALGGRDGVSSRKMFGGVCHLLDGTMLAGVWKDSLILRLGPRAADFALELPHVRPFDVTGRPMKGWVMVEAAGVRTQAQLAKWLDQALVFVSALPKKQ